MKIREGFVSNSSTTSFTCSACGRVVSYHDSSSDEDIGITRFNCGHKTCSCFEVDLSNPNVQKKWREDATLELNTQYPNDEDVKQVLEIEDFFEFLDACMDFEIFNPSSMCPVCSFKKISDKLAYKYILINHKLKLSDVKKEMKARFENIDGFNAWCEANKKT